MAEKIEAPIVGAEVDTSDMTGSGKNILMAMAGVALTLAIFAGGQTAYNFVAESTPDAVQPVEVF